MFTQATLKLFLHLRVKCSTNKHQNLISRLRRSEKSIRLNTPEVLSLFFVLLLLESNIRNVSEIRFPAFCYIPTYFMVFLTFVA